MNPMIFKYCNKKISKKSEARICLAMCLKKQKFQADCVYKLGVHKKKCVLTENIQYKKVSYTIYI